MPSDSLREAGDMILVVGTPMGRASESTGRASVRVDGTSASFGERCESLIVRSRFLISYERIDERSEQVAGRNLRIDERNERVATRILRVVTHSDQVAG